MANDLSASCCDLLDQQDGIVARWQLAANDRDLISADALLRRHRWQVIYRGVYAGYPGRLSHSSLLWAAVRRCGPDGVISHQTAAQLDDMTETNSRAADGIHITVPSNDRVRFNASEFGAGRPRIVLHRSSRVNQARHPAKTPPRTRIEETVLDLVQAAGDFGQAFSWLSISCSRRLTTPELLRAAASSRAKLRWRADLYGALADISDGVRSMLERLYVRNVERPHGLPKALRQAQMTRGGGHAYIDNFISEFGVAVELDGIATHPLEARWQDIRRDNYFARSGIITLRYNWADITQRPCEVAGEIALVLRQRGWTGTLRHCRRCRPANAA